MAQGKKHKVKRFVHASSIYANSSQGGFYSCSKRAADDYVQEFNKLYKLDYNILRFGSVYGSRSDRSNGVRKIIDKAIWKRKIIYRGTICIYKITVGEIVRGDIEGN